MNCLFCSSPNPKSIEHVIPESLGNDDLVLTNEVCSSCNAAFAQVENHVLSKTPIAFWRTFLGIKTKKGKMPHVDLSQPKVDKGVWPDRHPIHDNGIGFEVHVDGSVSVGISGDALVKGIIDGGKHTFKFVFTPRTLHLLGRFLAKVGIELLCVSDQNNATDARYDECRKYARYGSQQMLWPLYHFTEGKISDLTRTGNDNSGHPVIEVDCYSYSMKIVGDKYTVMCLGVGTDRWVMCLDDKYPDPSLRKAFGGGNLTLIWYSEDEMANKAVNRLP